jgi:hypothetical protein
LADAKTIADNWGTSGTAEIDIFYVALIDLGAVQGRAFFSAALASSDATYGNTIFMAAQATEQVVMAHESGHLITNRAHFGESGPLNYRSEASADEKQRNLMSKNITGSGNRAIGGNRRITEEQQGFTQ